MRAMGGNIWIRRLGTGLLTWLVPFLVAIPFYSGDGTLLTDTALFKSAMIVVSCITAAGLMIWFFSRATPPYAREAVITGMLWLFMNWGIDLLVLVGLLGMPPSEYVTQIGVRYLMIPTMVITAGVIADHAIDRKKESKNPPASDFL